MIHLFFLTLIGILYLSDDEQPGGESIVMESAPDLFDAILEYLENSDEDCKIGKALIKYFHISADNVPNSRRRSIYF